MGDDPVPSSIKDRVKVNFFIDAELYAKLKEYAVDTGQSMTDVVTKAVSHFLGVAPKVVDVGIDELAREKNLALPYPQWSDDELVSWIKTRQRHEVYNAIRVLIREGGSYRDFAFRLLKLTKVSDPYKYEFIKYAASKYAPDVFNVIRGWENEQEV